MEWPLVAAAVAEHPMRKDSVWLHLSVSVFTRWWAVDEVVKGVTPQHTLGLINGRLPVRSEPRNLARNEYFATTTLCQGVIGASGVRRKSSPAMSRAARRLRPPGDTGTGPAHTAETDMTTSITTFLTYDTQAEEAAKLYTSLFDGKIKETMRYPAGGPKPEGSVLSVAFELFGQTYIALNGGPTSRSGRASRSWCRSTPRRRSIGSGTS
jgi:hypothetical protein